LFGQHVDKTGDLLIIRGYPVNWLLLNTLFMVCIRSNIQNT